MSHGGGQPRGLFPLGLSPITRLHVCLAWSTDSVGLLGDRETTLIEIFRTIIILFFWRDVQQITFIQWFVQGPVICSRALELSLSISFSISYSSTNLLDVQQSIFFCLTSNKCCHSWLIVGRPTKFVERPAIIIICFWSDVQQVTSSHWFKGITASIYIKFVGRPAISSFFVWRPISHVQCFVQGSQLNSPLIKSLDVTYWTSNRNKINFKNNLLNKKHNSVRVHGWNMCMYICICMSICIYICIYICGISIYLCMYIYINTYTHLHV